MTTAWGDIVLDSVVPVFLRLTLGFAVVHYFH